jgi:hypothetical protein
MDPLHCNEIVLNSRVGLGIGRGCGGDVASRKQSRSDLLSAGWGDFLARGVVPEEGIANVTEAITSAPNAVILRRRVTRNLLHRV